MNEASEEPEVSPPSIIAEIVFLFFLLCFFLFSLFFRALVFVGPAPGRTYVAPRPIEVPPGPPQEFVLVTVDVTEADWLSVGPPKTRAGFRLIGAGWLQESLNP